MPASFPEDFWSFTDFAFLPSSFLSPLDFLHSVLIGILHVRLFPSLSTNSVAVVPPDDNLPSLLLLSRVTMIGILDFLCPASRPFLLPISLLANCEAIGFRPQISQAERRTKKLQIFLFSRLLYSDLLFL